MIRVLNIIDTMGSGGVERRRLSLAKLLDNSQFELKIICTNAVGTLPEEFKKYNIEVIAIGNLRSVFDYQQHKKVMAIIASFKPHIVHGAVFEGVTMAAVSGFFKRVPIVILEETSDPQNRSWKGNLLMKLLCTFADKVVGVSPAATTYLEDTIKINKRKVVLITNGVAIPKSFSVQEKSALKQQLGIHENDIVIGSVGRMSSDAHKRFSDLIKAVAMLVKKSLNIKLILVGEGPEKANYEDLVTELNLKDNVIFTGYQHETNRFYSIFDVFCLTSAFEAFGLVVAEAMFHQLPVVATKVGGMQYIVDDGITGFLVEKFDINAITKKLQILYLDADLRISFGTAGYEKAIQNYTEEKYVERVETLYMKLLKEKGIL
ncbi:MAG: glycosyltransferase [Flavobacterium sp.]|nr:glycosyltransferase [Flavobacterium sp.]